MPPPSIVSKQSVRSGQTHWFADEIYRHETSLKAYLRRSFPAAREDVDDVAGREFP